MLLVIDLNMSIMLPNVRHYASEKCYTVKKCQKFIDLCISTKNKFNCFFKLVIGLVPHMVALQLLLQPKAANLFAQQIFNPFVLFLLFWDCDTRCYTDDLVSVYSYFYENLYVYLYFNRHGCTPGGQKLQLNF